MFLTRTCCCLLGDVLAVLFLESLPRAQRARYRERDLCGPYKKCVLEKLLSCTLVTSTSGHGLRAGSATNEVNVRLGIFLLSTPYPAVRVAQTKQHVPSIGAAHENHSREKTTSRTSFYHSNGSLTILENTCRPATNREHGRDGSRDVEAKRATQSSTLGHRVKRCHFRRDSREKGKTCARYPCLDAVSSHSSFQMSTIWLHLPHRASRAGIR